MLDQSPAAMLPRPAMRQVAVITAAKSIPAPDRTPGITAARYTVAKKVVQPPRTSPARVAPFSVRWKNVSNRFIPPPPYRAERTYMTTNMAARAQVTGGTFFRRPVTRAMAA